jgi:hypothetical protein
MNNKTDPQAAFPDEYQNGMTLRDYFAAKAMQPFLDQLGCRADKKWFDEVAEGAYRMADAMMKAREA